MLLNLLVNAGDVNFMPRWDLESSRKRWPLLATAAYLPARTDVETFGSRESDRVTRMANIPPLAFWVSNMGHSFASTGFSWHSVVLHMATVVAGFDSPGGLLTIERFIPGRST